MNNYIQSVTRLFNKYSNICNGSLSNSLVTPYIQYTVKCYWYIKSKDRKLKVVRLFHKY